MNPSPSYHQKLFRVVTIGLLLVIGLVGWLFFKLVKMQSRTKPQNTISASLVDKNKIEEEKASLESGAEKVATDNAKTKATNSIRSSVKKITAEERKVLLAKIQQRLAQRSSSSSANSGTTAPTAETKKEGTLDKDYIRAQMREILPLIKECFILAQKEKPKTELAGKVKLKFSIVADEELGGVVEDSEVIESSNAIKNSSMSDCLRESMFALQFKAPKGGGQITVEYPFIFRSSSEETHFSPNRPSE